MSELVHFEYAPPRSWEQFEELCADLFEVMWGDPGLVRHGRAGQAQNGVDIVCSRGAVHPVGLQCKKKSKWPVARLSTSEIDKEIANAEHFVPPLKEFYLLTTAATDEAVQEHIRKLNVDRRQRGVFTVEVFFWPEIVRRVARHDEVARKHFPVHGGRDFSPLLATWYVKGGRLELDGMEWALSAREVAEDFHDWPNGHVNIRQRETDEATRKLAGTPVAKDKKTRERRLDLRRDIRRFHSVEREVEDTIRLLCTDQDLRFYVVDLDDSGQDTVDLLRAVVEHRFGSDEVGMDWQKIRVSPPTPERLAGPLTAATVAAMDIPIYLPLNVYFTIQQNESRFTVRWGNPIVRVVSELPSDVRKRFVFPSIVARIQRVMREDQKTIEQLRFAGYLSVNEWKYEL